MEFFRKHNSGFGDTKSTDMGMYPQQKIIHIYLYIYIYIFLYMGMSQNRGGQNLGAPSPFLKRKNRKLGAPEFGTQP